MAANGSRSEPVRGVIGGRLVTGSGVREGTILVGEDGRITAIVDPDDAPRDDRFVDAAGMLVFPGGIDTHSHLNDPGLTESEDFGTGTRGAAGGGYTTVLEMPQTLPLVESVETFRDKLETVAPKAVVDFGLYSALVPNNAENASELHAVADAGAVALKGFVCDTPEMPTLNRKQLVKGMRNAREAKLRVAIHAESQSVIDASIARIKEQEPQDIYAIAQTHPFEAEEAAVRSVLEAARIARGKLHLVHMSDPRTVELGVDAKAAGVDVSIETCPHYLALTVDALKEDTGWGLCFPPLRTESARDGLWRAIELGQIDAIGSDHCAYTLEQKAPSNPWAVLPGINGIQLALPLLVDQAMRRDVSLVAVAKAFSTNPAKRFSLHPRKGEIRVGADADLVFVDVNSSITARAKDLYTRCPGTIYEGMTFDARIRRTLVRGTTVYEDDGRPDILVDAGFGEFLNGDVARRSDGSQLVSASTQGSAPLP
jgi:allantoinase